MVPVFKSRPKNVSNASAPFIQTNPTEKVATQEAVEFIGLPEARIPLAHATAYMCRAKKSREAVEALVAAAEEIESEQTERVPERLKNKHFPVNPEE